MAVSAREDRVNWTAVTAVAIAVPVCYAAVRVYRSARRRATFEYAMSGGSIREASAAARPPAHRVGDWHRCGVAFAAAVPALSPPLRRLPPFAALGCCCGSCCISTPWRIRRTLPQALAATAAAAQREGSTHVLATSRHVITQRGMPVCAV